VVHDAAADHDIERAGRERQREEIGSDEMQVVDS
jgi:hypothetical protein